MKKILGLILELNPFHNGHKYFIEKAKEKINPDMTIAIITTSFTMRGEANLIDKFTRTQMLLDNGVDIVVELPFALGCVSADFFALNAIKILNGFGVNILSCGVETDNLELLKSFSKLIESDDFKNLLKHYLDQGLSYNTSCNKVIEDLTNDIENAYIFSMPNNTLCIQYLKAIDDLQIKMNVSVIKRIGDQYYDTTPNSSFASASSIRNSIANKETIKDYLPNGFSKYVFKDLKMINEKLYDLLYYCYLNNELNYSVKEGLENRIANMILSSSSFDELVNLVVTKRYPVNTIRRILMHILLKDNNEYINEEYYRVLGFRKNVRNYFSKLKIKKDIITSFKNSDNPVVLKEILVTKLYGLITNNKNLYLNEYKVPIIKDDENE